MTAETLRRLSRMTADEVSWRTRQTGRTAAQRVSVRVHHPRWNREDLREILADHLVHDLFPDRSGQSRWEQAHAALEGHLASRPCRFNLDPASSSALRREVLARWPSAARDAVVRADRMLAGEYDLLGYRALQFAPEGAVDWHFDPVHGRRAPLMFWADVPYLDPQIGDHKVIWEINRHQHWLRLGRAYWLTGDERYRQAIVVQLERWLAANPPLIGINWASMLEIGLRSISWIWGLHFLLAAKSQIPNPKSQSEEGPWLVDMLVGLHRQLSHVEQNLSLYFSPNTHLTGEALALYVAGVALPELAASSRWVETGRRILLTEIDRQIAPDGGHAERSTHYQRYTLDFYLMALLTAERDGDAEAAARFSDAATRLAEFTRAIADDEGRLPLIGDDDGGMLWPMAGRACTDVRDSLALAAVLLNRPALAPWGVPEEVFWIAGVRPLTWGEPRHPTAQAPRGPRPAARLANPTGFAPHVGSRTFPDTGYVVLRDASGSHAVFDAGAHGYLNGGHAHADALALTLTLAGRPLLIDPGTFTYTTDPRLRDRLRSSLSHNTLTLDGRSPSIPSGPFHWRSRTDATLRGRSHGEGFDWAEASHDGYAPVRHRRTIVRAAESGWLVADEVLGGGSIAASTHWHFDPDWTLTCEEPGRLRARHADGQSASLLHDGGDVLLVHGDDESGLGWYAPVYGVRVPTWTARTTRRAHGSLAMVTWIGAEHDAVAPPRLERIEGDGISGAIGVRVIHGSRSAVFLLRPGQVSPSLYPAAGVLEYETDARVLHYATDSGRLVALDIIDATHVRALTDGGISISAAERIADLHIRIQDDVIDLHATVPPSQIRIDGAAIHGVRLLRVNHRPLPARSARTTDTLVIDAFAWASGPDPANAAQAEAVAGRVVLT